MLRVLTLIVLALGALWSGYWWQQSARIEADTQAWLDATPWASARGIEVQGFPNRVDVTLLDPELSSGGLRWSGALLQILQLVYSKDHLILALPPEQEIAAGSEIWRVATDAMRASVVRGETPAPGRVVAEAARVEMTAPGGTTLRLSEPRAALTPVTPQAADFAVATGPVTTEEGLRLDALRLAGRVQLPTADWIEISDGTLLVDGVSFTITGRLEAGSDRQLRGRLTLDPAPDADPVAPLPEPLRDAPVTLTIADGVARIGATDLLRLPPLP
ncbi:DUF2125 domain-containing protein [Litorisediminicola beolgyonensis]|uniref:DUF2125 domain-containing protein n=1 Tax=Litorisediminicola beolgyonensis TaxID=1173614 RepID=A0ABW3ZNA0_9RHOB